jgi:hypothetical protein
MMSSMRNPRSVRPSVQLVHQSCHSLQSLTTAREVLTFGNTLQAKVQHGIVQRTAHEKLQTEVVDTLGIGECLALLGFVPVLDEAVSECQTGGRVGSVLIAVIQTASERGLDMADDLVLETVTISEAFDLVLGPGLALGLRDGSWSNGKSVQAYC